jgi:hypothetical protein
MSLAVCEVPFIHDLQEKVAYVPMRLLKLCRIAGIEEPQGRALAQGDAPSSRTTEYGRRRTACSRQHHGESDITQPSRAAPHHPSDLGELAAFLIANVAWYQSPHEPC